jgi:hypothetical protein
MTRSVRTRILCAAALAIVALLGTAGASNAGGTPDLILPAGVACNGFDLGVFIRGGNQVHKEFTDKNGNVVRLLSAGRGSALQFVNLSTDATFSLDANGSVSHVALNGDGSQTWMTTGHNVLILFPTDVPAGPSTTLYVGLVVFTVDTNGVFRLTEISGSSTDICAALSA